GDWYTGLAVRREGAVLSRPDGQTRVLVAIAAATVHAVSGGGDDVRAVEPTGAVRRTVAGDLDDRACRVRRGRQDLDPVVGPEDRVDADRGGRGTARCGRLRVDRDPGADEAGDAGD